jgi:hypothetical protein
MKKKDLIAITALTAILAGTAVYLIRKNRHNRRKDFVANAGYEMAYDIHYPVRYAKGKQNSKI